MNFSTVKETMLNIVVPTVPVRHDHSYISSTDSCATSTSTTTSGGIRPCAVIVQQPEQEQQAGQCEADNYELRPRVVRVNILPKSVEERVRYNGARSDQEPECSRQSLDQSQAARFTLLFVNSRDTFKKDQQQHFTMQHETTPYKETQTELRFSSERNFEQHCTEQESSSSQVSNVPSNTSLQCEKSSGSGIHHQVALAGQLGQLKINRCLSPDYDDRNFFTRRVSDYREKLLRRKICRLNRQNIKLRQELDIVKLGCRDENLHKQQQQQFEFQEILCEMNAENERISTLHRELQQKFDFVNDELRKCRRTEQREVDDKSVQCKLDDADKDGVPAENSSLHQRLDCYSRIREATPPVDQVVATLHCGPVFKPVGSELFEFGRQHRRIGRIFATKSATTLQRGKSGARKKLFTGKPLVVKSSLSRKLVVNHRIMSRSLVQRENAPKRVQTNDDTTTLHQVKDTNPKLFRKQCEKMLQAMHEQNVALQQKLDYAVVENGLLKVTENNLRPKIELEKVKMVADECIALRQTVSNVKSNLEQCRLEKLACHKEMVHSQELTRRQTEKLRHSKLLCSFWCNENARLRQNLVDLKSQFTAFKDKFLNGIQCQLSAEKSSLHQEVRNFRNEFSTCENVQKQLVQKLLLSVVRVDNRNREALCSLRNVVATLQRQLDASKSQQSHCNAQLQTLRQRYGNLQGRFYAALSTYVESTRASLDERNSVKQQFQHVVHQLVSTIKKCKRIETVSSALQRTDIPAVVRSAEQIDDGDTLRREVMTAQEFEFARNEAMEKQAQMQTLHCRLLELEDDNALLKNELAIANDRCNTAEQRLYTLRQQARNLFGTI